MATFLDHAFLSYSTDDEDAAHELVYGLEIRKKSIWFAPNRIGLGEHISIKIERGVDNARHLIVLISPSYLSSEWCSMERHSAAFRDPNNGDRKLIPLLLQPCDLPAGLRPLYFCDLTKGITPDKVNSIAEVLQ